MYSGKAAMQLMGDWDISSVLGSDKSFVTDGNLGMASFPSLDGGTGNPADLAGNTASYVGIASHATAAQKAVAMAFLQDALPSTSYARAEVGAGEVPVTKGASGLFAGQSIAAFDTNIYNSVLKAPELPVLLGPGHDPEGGDGDAHQPGPGLRAHARRRRNSSRSSTAKRPPARQPAPDEA